MLRYIVSLLVLTTSCGSEPPPPTPQVKRHSVRAVKPRASDIPLQIEAIGTLRASSVVDIQPQVEGMLTEIAVVEGQSVKKGDLLFKIDSAVAANRVKEITAIKNKTYASLQLQKKKLERFRSLAKKDLIPQIEWDELEADVAKGEASLIEESARLESALLDLERCSIVSPCDGNVGTLDLHVGNIVTKGNSLTRITQLTPLICEWHITEKEFRDLSRGSSNFVIESLYSKEISAKGEISFLNNHFDDKSGLLLVKGVILNPPAHFRPGQNVRVQAEVGTLFNVTLIPEKAVCYNQEGSYLYVVQDDDTIIFRSVRLGSVHNDEVVALEGVTPDERICLEGHSRLYPGATVEVTQ